MHYSFAPQRVGGTLSPCCTQRTCRAPLSLNDAQRLTGALNLEATTAAGTTAVQGWTRRARGLSNMHAQPSSMARRLAGAATRGGRRRRRREGALVGGRHSRSDPRICAWNKLCSCALGPPGRCDSPEPGDRLLARTLGRCRCGAGAAMDDGKKLYSGPQRPSRRSRKCTTRR